MALGPVVVQADGGSRGNPGPAGFGAVVLSAADGAVLAERFGFLGTTTNNVAEYAGVIAGLLAAAELGARSVAVRLDSRLIVEQMNGRWQVKDAKIRPLAARVADLRGRFEKITFDWLPRERNKHADRLANLAMDKGAAGEVPVLHPGDAGLSPGTSDAATAPAAGPGDDPPRGPAGGSVDGAAGGSTDGSAGGSVDGPPAQRAVDGLTRIVIVRHGETTLGAAGRFAGQSDAPLTARGRQQAVALADRLAGLRVAAVWTSPLERCRATAKPIGWRSRAAVSVVDGLTDGVLGPWTGRTPEEIAERWPAEFAAWRADVDVAPPGGESYTAVRRRAATVLGSVVDRHRGQTVVLVTHAVTAKMMLVEALGVPSPAVYRLRVDPASLSMIAVDAGGDTMVWTINEVGHLPV